MPDLKADGPTVADAMDTLHQAVVARLKEWFESNDPKLSGLVDERTLEYLGRFGYEPAD